MATLSLVGMVTAENGLQNENNQLEAARNAGRDFEEWSLRFTCRIYRSEGRIYCTQLIQGEESNFM